MSLTWVLICMLCGLLGILGQPCPNSGQYRVDMTAEEGTDIANALKQQTQNVDTRKGVVLKVTLKNITEISPSLLHDSVFGRVVVLDLSDNQLESITNGLFDSFKCVTVLNLSQNRIRVIQNNAFRNLDNLERLILRNNEISELPSELFGTKKHMRRLKEFDASFNNISSIASDIFHEGLAKLRLVRLSNNSLRTFEPWPYIPRLFHSGTLNFDVRYNRISSFSNNVGWKKTREPDVSVDLRHNELRYFRIHEFAQYLGIPHPTAFDIGILGLDVRDNPWFCDCGLYAGVNLSKDVFANLRAYNFLTCQSPSALKGRAFGYFFTHPEELVCNITDRCPKGCRCQNIPAYGHIVVDCHDLGSFTNLPESLPIGKLSVDMSGNRVVELASRSYLENVTQLDVSGNKLSTFDNSFLEQCNVLEYLDIRNNRLTTLPSRLQNFEPSDVKFKDNPLICTCESLWMNEWLRRFAQNFTSEDLDKYTCEQDGQVSRIVDVTWTSLVCYRDIAVGVSVGLGFLLIIFVTVTCICWRNKYECKVFLFDYMRAHPFDKVSCDKDDDATKQHDVYISIDRENEEVRLWVKEKLLKRLERKTKSHPGYNVYYPLRQDDVGDSIADQMIENINKSRRVLAVVNSTYIQQGWSVEEFDHAHRLMEEASSGRLLILTYGDLDRSKVTQEPLKSHLSGKQCFSLNDKWIWRKLRYELPYKPIKDKSSASRESLTSGISSIHATLSDSSDISIFQTDDIDLVTTGVV